MIYSALLSLAVIVALSYALRGERLQNAAREKEWALERSALLTRIQHPEIIIGQAQERPTPDEELMTAEPDEIDLVGTIAPEVPGA